MKHKPTISATQETAAVVGSRQTTVESVQAQPEHFSEPLSQKEKEKGKENWVVPQPQASALACARKALGSILGTANPRQTSKINITKYNYSYGPPAPHTASQPAPGVVLLFQLVNQTL